MLTLMLRDPEALRFFDLESLLRTDQLFARRSEVDAALARLYTALRDVKPAASFNRLRRQKLVAAMISIHQALAVLQGLALKSTKRRRAAERPRGNARGWLVGLGGVLSAATSA
jgi:hypothetical protein